MPVDFGLLQPAAPVSAFFQGQQAAQQQVDQNMLRQSQMLQMQAQRENMLAQQQERAAHAAQRKADLDRAAESESWLGKMGTLFSANKMPLTLDTAREAQLYAVRSRDKNAIDMMNKTVTALEEREALRSAFGGQAAPAAAPAAAPSMMRQPPAAAAAPTNMFAGTMADIGTAQPAPVNALAAPAPMPTPTPTPATGGMSRDKLQAIIANPDAPTAVVDRAKALLTAMPKEPGVPTPIQEFQAYQKMSPAEQAAYVKHRQELQPKPAQVSVKLPEQEKAERGERGKLLVEQYKVVSDAARLATRTLPSLETQERVLDAGFRTGFGAEAQKAGASVLAALGVPEAKDYATNAQTFSAAMSQAVLQKQLEQKGTQTKADSDRIEQTGAQITNTADANRFIINVARAQLRRDIAQRNFYDKWWKENKTYDGAEDAWATGEGNKSLFEDPALKKFAPAPAKAAPAVPAAATTGTQPFSDAAKERRYQEWKRSQGTP